MEIGSQKPERQYQNPGSEQSKTLTIIVRPNVRHANFACKSIAICKVSKESGKVFLTVIFAHVMIETIQGRSRQIPGPQATSQNSIFLLGEVISCS